MIQEKETNNFMFIKTEKPEKRMGNIIPPPPRVTVYFFLLYFLFNNYYKVIQLCSLFIFQ